MGFKEWIIPQDRFFYDLIERYVNHVKTTVTFFGRMVDEWTSLEERRQELKKLEHGADEIGHEIYHRLGRTFITPIDRDDLIRLSHSLDDIVDYVDAAGNRMALFKLESAREPMVQFVQILQKQVDELIPAIGALRRPKERRRIKDHVIEVHRLENEADRLLNRSIAQLFETKDPIEILKLKDIYENLENATDRCEDVADVLSDIVRKQG